MHVHQSHRPQCSVSLVEHFISSYFNAQYHFALMKKLPFLVFQQRTFILWSFHKREDAEFKWFILLCDINWPNINEWNLSSFPGVTDGKESACNAGDLGSIPGSGRSPGAGNGNPLHCQKKSMDSGVTAGYSSWGCKESDMTEWLILSNWVAGEQGKNMKTIFFFNE